MNIDLSYLEDITGRDKEMMVEMLNLFIEDIPNQVALIQDLAQQKDFSRLGSESHKLKPTLQYVGLIEMYEIVKELEILGKSGNHSEKIISLAKKMKEYSIEAMPLLLKKKEDLSY